MTTSMRDALGRLYKAPQQRKEIGAKTLRALINRGFATVESDAITIAELGRSAAESGIAGWIRRSQA